MDEHPNQETRQRQKLQQEIDGETEALGQKCSHQQHHLSQCAEKLGIKLVASEQIA